MPFEYTVTENEENIRVDKVITNINKNICYAFLQKIFRLNKIKVNGAKVHPSHKVHCGDLVQIYADISVESGCSQKNSVYNQNLINKFKDMIIFENDDFLAINKPTNLAVQLGTKISFCVENLMKAYQEIEKCECKLVHRIDKDTSGVLLIAKNTMMARKLTELFRNNKIQKTYIAVVDGKITNSGIIDNYIEKSLIGNEEKMRVSERGQHAITKYRVLKTNDPGFRYFSMLELQPQTGRKHQLRVHCSESLRSPILGDKKYNKHFTHTNLFLHAYKIVIEDFNIEIIAPIPAYFPKNDSFQISKF